MQKNIGDKMGRQEIRDKGLKNMSKLANLFASKKTGHPEGDGQEQLIGPWYAQFMEDTDNCAMTTNEEKAKLQMAFGKVLALFYCMGYQDAKEKVAPQTLYIPKTPDIQV